MKRYIITLLLALVVPLYGADTTSRTEKIYRIMPVGDSITEGGKTFSVYRYPLWEKLKSAGYHIEYVGSRTSNSPAGPLKHEGHGGKNAEFLATVVPDVFRQHPADIVLIHAGHNHFVEEQPVPTIVAAIESMIAEVRTVNPHVIVLVAQVIPSGKLPKYSYIPALNEALAKMVERLNTPDQPVIIVNQAEGFDPNTDTIQDKVHPNAGGAEKMATRWFDALTRVLEKPTQHP
ncbi:MAG: SGNH/GDSL hydrolase family protein [Terrimicrobiaceae bacterium]